MNIVKISGSEGPIYIDGNGDVRHWGMSNIDDMSCVRDLDDESEPDTDCVRDLGDEL